MAVQESSLIYGVRGTTYVSFVCQRCYQPLRLDHSFNSLDPDARTDLTTPLPSPSDEVKQDLSTSLTAKEQQEFDSFKDDVLPQRNLSMDGNGFTLLGEAASDTKTDNLSHRLKVSTQLFDVMSGQSEVDHPLCEECTDTLLCQLDKQLQVAEREYESYKRFLDSLDDEEETDEAELDGEIEKLQKEERELMEQLEQCEIDREGVAKQLEELDVREKELGKEEELCWRNYCEYRESIEAYHDEQASVNNQLQHVHSQLDKLRKTNVFNSTFHIWHRGHFGTINSFRLGRLPSVPVEWTEINAAWGQTVLLLFTLAKKIGLTFDNYRLVPYGNHSYIEVVNEKKELPLYGAGGFRFFWDTKFDQAMTAFLDCLQQFKEEVERGDSGFYLPYRMEKGKIYDSTGSGSFSIKIQFNSEEHWTKALKFMLTNLKWGLAWVSSQFADK